MPPAVAVMPPVSAPSSPCSDTAFRTPCASECPNPVSGTVAPHPANFTSGPYTPTADRITPLTTYPTRIRAGVSRVKSISTCPIKHSSPPMMNAFR